MTNERWQLVAAQTAIKYDTLLAPVLMEPWASATIAAARIAPGNQVLDVACGTGVVSRLAADHSGADALVTGLDLNPHMLSIAANRRPDISWIKADATALPFPDDSFDRVICQFGLMFFTDRLQAVCEMARVLRPAGRLIVATWGPIEVSPPYLDQAEIVSALVGPEAEAIVRAPFLLADPSITTNMLRSAGFESITCETLHKSVTYPSMDHFIAAEIDATPLGSFLDLSGGTIRSDIDAALRARVTRRTALDGSITYPTEVHIHSGTRADHHSDAAAIDQSGTELSNPSVHDRERDQCDPPLPDCSGLGPRLSFGQTRSVKLPDSPDEGACRANL